MLQSVAKLYVDQCPLENLYFQIGDCVFLFFKKEVRSIADQLGRKYRAHSLINAIYEKCFHKIAKCTF